jgi:hypothetical protein
MVAVNTLGGRVLFDTVEIKTLKEAFSISLQVGKLPQSVVNLKNGQNIS